MKVGGVILFSRGRSDESSIEVSGRLDGHCLSSAVGVGVASEFIAFIELTQKINIKDILKNPQKIKDIKEMSLKYSVLSGLIEHYRKDKKTLNEVTAICEYVEPEFAIMVLRFLKTEDENYFKRNIVKYKNWKKLSSEYLKYLV